MADSKSNRKAGKSPPSTSPDELIKDLDVKVTDSNKVKGGAGDIFAKIGDIKGESLISPRRAM